MIDVQAAEALLRHNRPKLVDAGRITPNWSDDGARFSYQVTRSGADHTYEVDPTAGTRNEIEAMPTPPGTGDFLAVVSPDGKHEVFRKGPDLWLRTVSDGSERPLTTDGEVDYDYGTSPFAIKILLGKLGLPHLPSAVAWSADSRRILTHQLDSRLVREAHLIDVLPDDGGAPELLTQRYAYPGDEHVPLAQFVVLDVETGAAVRAQSEPFVLSLLSPIARKWAWWSGETVYFLDQPRDQRTLELKRLDPTTGEVSLVVSETAPTRIEPNQFMDLPAISRVCGDEVLWYSQRDGWPHLYRYDVRTGELLGQITSGEWSVRQLLHVDLAERVVYFTAAGLVDGSPLRRTVCRIGLDGSGFARVTNDDLDHEVAVPPNGGYFVDSASTVGLAPVHTVRSWTGQLLVELEAADSTALVAIGWQPPEEFRVLAADGVTELYGLLYKPHDFDPTVRYPIVDHPYAGPQTNRVVPTFDPGLYGAEADPMAALGFVVVVVDARGVPGREKAFHDASYGNYSAGIDDHVAAIRQLAETRPWMDLDRVGIFGASGGGYSTVRAMGEFPEFFKVGVAESGNLDNRYYLQAFGETYVVPPGLPATTDGSLLDYADQIEGKLLLMHGGLDDNVHPHHTLRLTERLIAAGKDFDLLVLPRAEHIMIGYEHYVVRRRWNYLLQHLAGVTPPPYQLKPATLDLSFLSKLTG
ncbi:DPP IV N-terminal domain-containing protein [Kribbella yunnanensis]|uniref:DPP IV N-terminal domain-containing protein n=1 Tax=Kribbella yunnanensis TaxID=190194 RepID=A0ABP4VD33_9ACTN